MLAEARRLGIPVVEDASMVDQLIGHAIGDRIPQETSGESGEEAMRR
jgi:type III secretion system FlhB-like substrate exporter